MATIAAAAEDLIARVGEGLPLPASDSWREGLEIFLGDLARSQTLLPGAREGIENYVVATLKARFGVEDWLARHPQAAAAPVKRPLFIVGMPRAGTTLLLNMLRFDPQRRVLWHWEGNRELPPARTAHLLDDPRLAMKVHEVNAMLDSGALPRNHHVELGDEPTECIWPLGQDFKGYPWLVQTLAPDYFEWLMHEADMRAAYGYQRRYMQVLQSSAPGSWTLKLPSHARAVEEIIANFPDARIVFTHRDPIKPVASSCSLCDQILSLQNHTVDRAMLGYQTARLNALGAERMSAARDAHPEVPFLDIHYKPFTADPMATIRQLYAFEGMDLLPEVEAKMQATLDRHNADRSAAGEHRYTLEDYGLSEAGLDAMFGDYVSRYGIELERK
jgi:hypothetical protein